MALTALIHGRDMDAARHWLRGGVYMTRMMHAYIRASSSKRSVNDQIPEPAAIPIVSTRYTGDVMRTSDQYKTAIHAVMARLLAASGSASRARCARSCRVAAYQSARARAA